MPGLLQKSRRFVPLVGDMLFSVLTIPLSFNYLKKWAGDTEIGNVAFALCAMYAAMGAAHLFRAFRLRAKSRSAFIAHLVYGSVFMACVALVAIAGPTMDVMSVIALAFWASLLAERVLAIVRRRNVWNIAFNVVMILLLLALTVTALMPFSTIVVVMLASLSALASVMVVAFSRVKLDVLKEIIRKTYAAEIISGLLLLIVAFSYMLKFTDEAFASFWDALWYCFAVVTTIGFGDLTPTTTIGRLLSVILGLYGIVVVALITSIIVNFYGEMKKEGAKYPDGGVDGEPAPSDAGNDNGTSL